MLGSALSLLLTRCKLGDSPLRETRMCWDLIVEPCVNSTVNLKTGFKVEGFSSCEINFIRPVQFVTPRGFYHAFTVWLWGGCGEGVGCDFSKTEGCVSVRVIQRLTVIYSHKSVQKYDRRVKSVLNVPVYGVEGKELHLVLEGWASAGTSRLIEIINKQLQSL